MASIMSVAQLMSKKDSQDIIKGYVPATKPHLPVKLLWCCTFPNRYKAYGFERYLKSGSGRALGLKHLFYKFSIAFKSCIKKLEVVPVSSPIKIKITKTIIIEGSLKHYLHYAAFAL